MVNLLDKALKSEYIELFKDGLSEGEGVGVGIHFQQKMMRVTESCLSGFHLDPRRRPCTNTVRALRTLADVEIELAA